MGTSISIGINSADPPVQPPTPTPPELSFILQESVDYVLLESGDQIQVEY